MSVSEPASRTLTARRVESVHAADSVRHVDELSPSELDRFVESVESGSPVAADDSSFTDGELIVYTDYYRIEQA